MNILILTLILISLHRLIFSREIYATIIRRVENEGFHRYKIKNEITLSRLITHIFVLENLIH